MVNSNLLRCAGLLAFVGCLVMATNCHDFEEAFSQCQDAGLCFPDEDNDGVADAFDGCPSDTKAPLPGDLKAGKCDPASKLCLKHECPIEGDYELTGLWGNTPLDVFLTARSRSSGPAWFVRFGGTTFTSEQVEDRGFQPWRLHGSSATNVWSINDAASACSARKLGAVNADAGPVVDDAGVIVVDDAGVVDAGMEVDAGDGTVTDAGTGGPVDAGVDGGTPGGPDAGPGTLSCPSPVYRFTEGSWAQVAYGDGTSQLQTPAIFAAEPARAWAVDPNSNVVRWENGAWTAEPQNLGTGAAPKAFWGDATAPRFAVGADGRQSTATWQRSNNTWSGPTTLSVGPFIAISGPSEDHLYAATSSSVFKWNRVASRWELEPSAAGQASIQDLWVSGDGSEVWVALNSASVLRKQGTDWQTITLPVAPSFMAYRIIGFDAPSRDLWITGSHSSSGFTGTIAYHFSRQP